MPNYFPRVPLLGDIQGMPLAQLQAYCRAYEIPTASQSIDQLRNQLRVLRLIVQGDPQQVTPKEARTLFDAWGLEGDYSTCPPDNIVVVLVGYYAALAVRYAALGYCRTPSHTTAKLPTTRFTGEGECDIIVFMDAVEPRLAGDMYRSVYDKDGNNVVDTCDSLAWTKLSGAPTVFPPDASAEKVANKGVANGYPSLDANAHIPTAQLPPGIGTGDMLKSTYDTNADGVVDVAALANAVAWGNITGRPSTFTPTVHAGSHQSGGLDPIPLDTLAAPTDNTNLNASLTRHGLMIKLNGNGNQFFDGTGAFSTPPTNFTTTAGSYPVPAQGSTVVISMGTPYVWIQNGMVLYIAGAGGTNIAGALTVTALNGNQITCRNDGNALAGATIPNAALVTVAGPGIAEAPTDGQIYGRKSSAWFVMTGGGDMLKSIYDTNNSGKVDSCDSLPWTSVTGTPSTYPAAPHEVQHVTGTDQIPSASASTRGLLGQVSGVATDYVSGNNSCLPLAPSIGTVRLRSYNALAWNNPNFEVDQRTIFALNTIGLNTWLCDRWQAKIPATATLQATGQSLATNVLVPGTNMLISSRVLRITLTQQQASLGAGDSLDIWTYPENWLLRELFNDVHTAAILVRSSVANLVFGLSMADQPITRVLAKTCTLGAANTWSLIQLANMPAFPSGGNFSFAPGANSNLIISLAEGTNNVVPANDSWQTVTGKYAPVGIGNFAGSPVGATIDIGFLHWEPGPLFSQLMDIDWLTNYERSMRCYSKSYPFGSQAGGANFAAAASFYASNTASANAPVIFPKRMAKAPTVAIYNASSGVINSVYRATDGTAVAVTGTAYVSDAGFLQIQGTFTVGTMYLAQWTADTGL